MSITKSICTPHGISHCSLSKNEMLKWILFSKISKDRLPIYVLDFLRSTCLILQIKTISRPCQRAVNFYIKINNTLFKSMKQLCKLREDLCMETEFDLLLFPLF